MGHCRICKIEYAAEKDLKFHRLPKDANTRSEWIKIIGKNVPDSSLVCSKHFLENDYILGRNGKKTMLKKGSIPKLSVPNKTSLITNNSNKNTERGSNHRKIIYVKGLNANNVCPNKILHCKSFLVLNSSLKLQAQNSNSKIGHLNDKTKPSVSEKSQKKPAKCKESKKCRDPKFPGDLRPEHFVQREHYEMLRAYLIKQRKIEKAVSKRTTRWRQQFIKLSSLLCDLQNNAFLSNETADRIRVSLKSIKNILIHNKIKEEKKETKNT